SPGVASTTARSSNASSRTRSSTPRRSSMSVSSTDTRAGELRETLHRALIAYHVDDDPIMSDAAYDALYDELVRLEEEHPELVTQDSPTQRAGAPPPCELAQGRHLQAMRRL